MPLYTPFYDKHIELEARLTDFGGYEMPISYKGIKIEHKAVRNHVGLFDVSHMGEFIIKGPEALDLIQWIITNDASKLEIGKALYTVMCYENGGIVDDLLVYKLSNQQYMFVVNAANITKDFNWITRQNNFDAEIKNISTDTCLLAVQGPKSIETVQKLTEQDVSKLGYYRFDVTKLAGYDDILLSRTGYTGETGFELYFDKKTTDPVAIWDATVDAGNEFGVEPAGLGARDSLRLEMGLALYGNDIDEQTNPLEAKLNWLVKFKKGNFIGKSMLKEIQTQGVHKVLTGISMCEPKRIPRTDYPLNTESGKNVGKITSGGYSISLGKGIGMAYVEKNYKDHHDHIMVEIRGKQYRANLVKPPFLKK